MSRTLIINGVSDELMERPEALSRGRGQSVSSSVVEILESALSASRRRERLRRFATWTAEDLAELESNLRLQRRHADRAPISD